MWTRPRIQSHRDLTPEQRRRELIDLLGSAAARMPNAVAIPHDPPTEPPREKLSEYRYVRHPTLATR